MLNKDYIQPRIILRAFAGLFLVLSLLVAFLLFPETSSAHTTGSTTTGPTFKVNAGFDGRYKDGNWVPVQITLSNNGPDFNGTISINPLAAFSGQGSNSSSSNYQLPISLPNGSQKQVTLNIPLNAGTPGISQTLQVSLLDNNGNIVNSQVTNLRSLGQGDILIGILSDQSSSSFSRLTAVTLPSQGSSILTQSLNADTLPGNAEVLLNFDLIVLDNFTTSTLKSNQLLALQTWVNQGGQLILVGGPEALRTFGSLPAGLAPVQLLGQSTLPAGTRLLPISGLSNESLTKASVQNLITISTATLLPDYTESAISVLTYGTTPLIVQARQGAGSVTYLAFDPTLEPIASWSGATTLWQGLIQRSLGDQLLPSQYGMVNALTNKYSYIQANAMINLQQSLFPGTFPSPWLLLGLFLGYIFALGPLRFLIIRWRKRRDWSWRIVLSIILIFTLISYGTALFQKGTTIDSNSISVVRLNQGGTSAHTTTYVGVFVPNDGNFNVHLPGNNLVQPADNGNFQSGSGGIKTSIANNQDGSDVNLLGVSTWTLRSLVSEQDQPVSGGIVSHLQLTDGLLTGTVTNTLNYALSDVFVLIANNYVSLGRLEAASTSGDTRQVNLQVTSAAGNNSQSIIDQIAKSYGLPTPYGQYVNGNGSQPKNEFERRLSILSALSGVNNSPYVGVCPPGVKCAVTVYNAVGISSASITLSGIGPGPISQSNGLLVPGSPATLIGWADQGAQGTNNISINGSNVSGVKETLVQAPLNVHFSGALKFPANYYNGRMVAMQNNANGLQMVNFGIYSLSEGSVTFEYNLPNISQLQADYLTFTEPPNMSQYVPSANGVGSSTDINSLQVNIYNWKNGNWENIPINSYTFSTSSAIPYIGPGGRVLLQLVNNNSAKGAAAIASPSLTLEGAIIK